MERLVFPNFPLCRGSRNLGFFASNDPLQYFTRGLEDDARDPMKAAAIDL